MVEDLLLAAAYLGLGLLLVSIAWFVAVTLWISLYPNRDTRTAKAYRLRAAKPFDLRAHMGMK
jgi:hypothetical protein